MPWSKLQESDTFMRVIAIAGGIIAFIESILHLIGIFEIWSFSWFWEFGWIIEIIAVVLAFLSFLLGIKPIQYTPTFLGIFGLLLIIFSVFVGGIIVLLAAIIGAIT